MENNVAQRSRSMLLPELWEFPGGKIEAVNKGGTLMQRGMTKLLPSQPGKLSEEEFLATLLRVIVLFCTSGTGIYGSLDARMTGDSTILISKSILDFFTAAIFACGLGYVVSLVVVPQFIIFAILFYLAGKEAGIPNLFKEKGMIIKPKEETVGYCTIPSIILKNLSSQEKTTAELLLR